MPHILINTRLPLDIADQFSSFPDVRVTFSPRGLREHHAAVEFPPEEIRDVDLLVCTTPPKNFSDMTSLQFIQLASVGFGQLYGLDIVSRGIRAANARGVYDTAIGEWNLAMMINLARDLRGMIRNQEHGLFQKAPRFASELRGQVVGLWGYGGIGRETARLAKMLGMTVHAYARSGIKPRGNTYTAAGSGDPEGKLPDRVFTKGQELEFLRGLDFLILSLPLTPQSTGLIGEPELRALKPTAYLLNPARGPLIQEEALLKALREGWFAGAALDTHYYYPMPADHPLWRFPNVIMTPHISGSDLGPLFTSRMTEILLHNVRQFLSGGRLWNELTPEDLSGKN
jgi:phosphoglycerate dehydrogenase-like enzyme